MVEFPFTNNTCINIDLYFYLLTTEKKTHKKETVLYLAPLQGFTDFIYRKCYAKIFTGINTYFIPYVTVKKEAIVRKHRKEIAPENNIQNRVVPQVLIKSATEMIFLSEMLSDVGYNEINLNLGCPYPMVTNQGKGAGLLTESDMLEKILTLFYGKTSLQLSVKLRAGLHSIHEIKSIIPVLNQFPITEVIFHPRIAKQLYSGKIYEDAFRYALSHLEHPLVYNGDIFSINDFNARKQKFPNTNSWMLGRGILMNPFLPTEIKNTHFSEKEKKDKIVEFHQLIFDEYLAEIDNDGNVLNKMKQFWSYFCYNFPESEKCFKQIKKAKTVQKYRLVTDIILHT